MSMKIQIASAVLAAFTTLATAQWAPNNGDWGKQDPTDIRVMTWNIRDGIVSTSERKNNGFNDWNALVHIVAALKPDVLIMQEVGDASGNGSGSGADSVGELTAAIDLFLHGGNDPFEGGIVNAYVQLHDPSYDLPYVFVSNITDGFNRNVILSRFPIADINGDGQAQFSNFVLIPDEYQDGGNGGIRDFMHAEIDLPDSTYLGDMVIGNSHLKSGGSSSDFSQRLAAVKKITYFIDYFFNGAGTANADPNNKIAFPASSPPVLNEFTPVIWGGDLNENEATNGRKGPAEWLTRAQNTGGNDGTDRDRSDSVYDNAAHPINGQTGTFSNTNKIDYLLWQDSIAQVRRQFIFYSSGTGMTTSRLPIPVRNFPIQPLSTSGLASDHRPVVIDFMLPLAPPDGCLADWNNDGELNFFDVAGFLDDFAAQNANADITNDGTFDFFDVAAFLDAFSSGCP
jgi:endonuclease/exonuclease/phosphatase family metal-dependent hydrolase